MVKKKALRAGSSVFTDNERAEILRAARTTWETIHSDLMAAFAEDERAPKFADVLDTVVDYIFDHGMLKGALRKKVDDNSKAVERILRADRSWY